MLVWLFTLYCMLVGIVFAHFLNGTQYMLDGDASSAHTDDRSELYQGSVDVSESIIPDSRASSPDSSVQRIYRNNSTSSLLSTSSTQRSLGKLTASTAKLVDDATAPAELCKKEELMLCKVFLSGHIDIPPRNTNEELKAPYALSDATYTIYNQLHDKPSDTLTKANHDILDIFGASYIGDNSSRWCIVIHVIAKDYKSVPYTGIICNQTEKDNDIIMLYNHHFYKNDGYIDKSAEWGRMPLHPYANGIRLATRNVIIGNKQ